MQTLALTDRESLCAVVGTNDPTIPFADDAGLGTHAVGEPAPGVAVGDEADVVTVGFRRDTESTGCRLRPHLGLRGGGAQGKHRMGDLLRGEHAQHIRLIFCPGCCAMQLTVAVGIRHDRGVMSGDDRVEPEVERFLEQCGELDALVASHARVGGATGLVLGHEVVDDIDRESCREVPDIKRDADDVGRAAGVR